MFPCSFEYKLSDFRVNVDALHIWDWFMLSGEEKDGKLYRLSTYRYWTDDDRIEITVEEFGHPEKKTLVFQGRPQADQSVTLLKELR